MSADSSAHALLGAVADKLDIAEHTSRYNEFWDDGRCDAWVDTWTSDGRFILPGAPDTVGRAALRTMAETMSRVGFVHLTTNHRVTVDGDDAAQVCSAILARRDVGRGPETSTWLTSGRYDDRLVRTADGWRFTQRRFTPDASLAGFPQWW